MKPMLATKFNASKVKYPCYVQHKYDGTRCLLFEGDDGVVHLMSRGGKEYNIPHIKEWGESHRTYLPLDGELYNQGELTFQQICSAVKCLSKWTERLQLVVYDAPIKGSFASRWQRLKELFKDNTIDEAVYLAETRTAVSEDQIHAWHKLFVELGFEGIIIRNADGEYVEGRSNNLMKLKFFDTTEFEIVDVVEASGQDAGTAIFKLKSNGYVFCARPVGSKSLRAEYLRDRNSLIGKNATVQHQSYSDAGVPRFPVLLSIRDYE